MAKERQIAWEKWRCPYGTDIIEAEFPGAHGTFKTDAVLKKMEEGSQIGFDEEDWDEEFDDADIEQALLPQNNPKNIQSPMRILSTAMGIIPITEHTSPGKVFNFWNMHTNFRVGQEEIYIIDNTEGVETFDFFTEYRCRIGIGKCFNSAEVKREVMKNLNAKSLKLKSPGENAEK